MGRTCTICYHPLREKVEGALLAGKSYRHVALQYSVSTAALARHRSDHLTPSLAESHKAMETARATTLLEDVRSGENRAERLYQHAETILAKALQMQDLKVALNAVKVAVGVMAEARGYLELRGQLSDQLGERNAPRMTTTINVLSMPRVPGAPIRASDPPIDLSRLPAVQVAHKRD